MSLVLHPRNPYCPTVHMNVRFFVAATDATVWWFGGGMDLTPYYGFEEDARHFHRTLPAMRSRRSARTTTRASRSWCDDYFYLKHRDEPRGIGGIFFDDFAERGFRPLLRAGAQRRRCISSPPTRRSCERRKDTPFGERERDFQAYRRGRYVEFNLVYDRGTLFGLQSGGRTESILMSMPPRRLALRLEARSPGRPKQSSIPISSSRATGPDGTV